MTSRKSKAFQLDATPGEQAGVLGQGLRVMRSGRRRSCRENSEEARVHGINSWPAKTSASEADGSRASFTRT